MLKIDTHAHWYPPEWVDLILKEGEKNGAKLSKNDKGHVTITAPGIALKGTFQPTYVHLSERLKLMDAARVDMHALSLTSPMVYWALLAFSDVFLSELSDETGRLKVGGVTLLENASARGQFRLVRQILVFLFRGDRVQAHACAHHIPLRFALEYETDVGNRLFAFTSENALIAFAGTHGSERIVPDGSMVLVD